MISITAERFGELLAAEARMAAVRRALDDEIANLADDGSRLSHAVVRRIEAAMATDDRAAKQSALNEIDWNAEGDDRG